VTPYELAMLVPLLLLAAVRTLDEADSLLNEPPRQQALPTEGAGNLVVETV
jgi:hypothetical protein